MPQLKLFATVPLMALAACVSLETGDRASTRDGATNTVCGGPAQPVCQFFDGPFQLASTPVRVPTREAQFFPLARPLGFVDSDNDRWVAPPGTLTDGASIPPIFVAMLGNPRAREFANGAAMHDAYCGIGNERLAEYHSRDWRDTHRMFYDGLRVGGTDEIRAKIMYAAVYLGGPRWGRIGRDLSAEVVLGLKAGLAFSGPGRAAGHPALERALQDRLADRTGAVRGDLGFVETPNGPRYDAGERDLSGVPVWRMQRLMRETMTYIRTTRPVPTLLQIEAFIEAREARMLTAVVGRGSSKDSDYSAPQDEAEGDCVDGTCDPTGPQ